MFRALVMSSMLFVACGPAPEPTGTGGGTTTVTCTPAATLLDDTQNNRTILTARGEVSCSGVTDISIETCLQLESGGSFSDVQCVTATKSGVQALQSESQVGCIGTKTFRTRVTSTAGGQTTQATSQPRSLTCG